MIPIDELTPLLGQEDAAFSAWRNTVPDKHWVKLDLSALRIGYELGKRTLAQQQGGEQEAGDAVADSLRATLAARDYRTDGDVKALLARIESMALEDRDCINAGRSIIAEYKARLAALRTKHPAVSEGDWRDDRANRMCDVLAAYNQAVSDLSGEYECGWNANNCRPRLHRHVDRLRRLVLYHMQALRTKQPEASEGDGRVDLQQFRPAVVNWRNEQRGTIKQLEDSVSQLGSGTQKLVEDRLREADRLLAIIDNTSKQAAGEAVAWQIMRAAFVTADENYSGKRVAAVYADASMIGQRVRLIFDTTPPTQQEARAVGCRAKLAPDQWFHFCGETDMGQTLPVLCEACEPGGLKRA